MDYIFIDKKLYEETDQGVSLLEQIQKHLITPDVITGMKAGCQFEVTCACNGDGIINISIKSKERVSILKTPEGKAISVMVERI